MIFSLLLLIWDIAQTKGLQIHNRLKKPPPAPQHRELYLQGDDRLWFRFSPSAAMTCCLLRCGGLLRKPSWASILKPFPLYSAWKCGLHSSLDRQRGFFLSIVWKRCVVTSCGAVKSAVTSVVKISTKVFGLLKYLPDYYYYYYFR